MSWQITIDSDDCPHKLQKWDICTLTYQLEMQCNEQHCPKKGGGEMTRDEFIDKHAIKPLDWQDNATDKLLKKMREEFIGDLDDLLAWQKHELWDNWKEKKSDSFPSTIRDEMDADMEDSGMAQGEIESCLIHWGNKYMIRRKKEEK
jgi:hypothetical protein